MKAIKQNPDYFRKLVTLRKINLDVDVLLKTDEEYPLVLSFVEQERAVIALMTNYQVKAKLYNF